jgi:mannose-6-phosphate isomerase
MVLDVASGELTSDDDAGRIGETRTGRGGDPYAERPISLPPNQPARPYHGGAGIARLRGLPGDVDDRPEDFVGSTTAVLGSDTIGLTVLDDGRTLREHVEGDPAGFLGPAHVARYGDDVGLLVKLLDPGERLFVHFHPDVAFATRHLDCRHGKSEGWIVTDVAPLSQPDAGHVYLGFRDDVDAATVAEWTAGQRVPEMLAAMNRIPVRAGDTFFVPAGVPHAIGAGITAVELQEPTDFSILLEWEGFDVPPEARQLGLDPETALSALDRRGLTGARLDELRATRPSAIAGVTHIFPEAADPFFRAERLRIDGELTLDAGFSIIVVLAGEGRLETPAGSTRLSKGTCVLLPYAAGETRISGGVEAIRCRPPNPDAR